MNKCLCFCGAFILYITLCLNVTFILIAWLRPELLNPNWWKVTINNNETYDIHITINNLTTTAPNIGLHRQSHYKIYWHMPSIACSRFGYNFTYARTKYGIVMNRGDKFRGEHISILYDPGLFPLVKNYINETTNLDEIILINGGIPQDGNLLEHLEAFEEQVDKEVPDRENEGLIIIDMEQWGVMWEFNFNHMLVNHRLSIQRVQDKYVNYTIQEVTRQARKEYDTAAKRFMLITLRFGKAIRPKAKWGYYQYPQCFNSPKETDEGIVPCSAPLRKDNDRTKWLYQASDAIFPSTYLSKAGTVRGRAGMIRGRIQEAKRIEKSIGRKLPNFPYITIMYYHHPGIIMDEDLENLLTIPKQEGSGGVIVWGSSSYFSTAEKCLTFSTWLNNTFGPMAKRILNS